MEVGHLNQRKISEATLERWRSEGDGAKFLNTYTCATELQPETSCHGGKVSRPMLQNEELTPFPPLVILPPSTPVAGTSAMVGDCKDRSWSPTTA